MTEGASKFLYDVQTVKIVVKQIGPNRVPPVFHRIIDRFSRQALIQVSESPRRLFRCGFVTSVPYSEFSELQTSRRIFAVIGVACSCSFVRKHSAQNANQSSSVVGQREQNENSNSSTGANEILNAYEKLKNDYNGSILDSRCLLLGFENKGEFESIKAHERLCYPSLEEAESLEASVRDLMRSIYIVIESKRIDVSFEKQLHPCPMLPDEKRYQVGIDTTTKIFKKKCIGRCKKQHADYCLLTGLPQLALDAYAGAIENLRAAADYLWLGAAYDGWASAAAILHAEQICDSRLTGFLRVASMTAMSSVSALELDVPSNRSTNSSKEVNVSNSLSPLGHMRHHSDEHLQFCTPSPKSNGSFGNESGIVGSQWSREEVKKKPTKVLAPIASLLGEKAQTKPTKEDVMKYYGSALEEYNKYSVARWLEYECAMRAAVFLMLERDYIRLENFHRDYTGKYLDDMNTLMDHNMKAQICLNSADMYKEIGFLRKHAFYSRLSVLFELHSSEGSNRTSADYRIVYPILYRSLEGYGIKSTDQVESMAAKRIGPVELQIKCLHELYTAANRAELYDAAIRHLTHLLQVFFHHMESAMVARLFEDLDTLTRGLPSIHYLNQVLAVNDGKIILPAMQLTRFPSISDPKVSPLHPHLAPTVAQRPEQPSIFIYSPFSAKKNSNTLWVVDCPGEVEAVVRNYRDTELVVRDLCLLADGVKFESVPARLVLPPYDPKNVQAAVIKLIGIPRSTGDLFITGYSCQVFELRNVCRFYTKDSKVTRIQVKVVPKLAFLRMECSLPKAPTDEHNSEPIEAVVYSGQHFLHTITVVNESDIRVRYAGLQIMQPTVSGGPPLIMVEDKENIEEPDINAQDDCLSFSLEPKMSRQINFHIYGIDPASTADDLSEEEKVLESVTPLANASGTILEGDSSGEMDLIPYTGRLLTCDFVLRYHSDICGDDDDYYERKAVLPIAITILPAVTVSAWHVLPGDGPFSRYIVVDVTNSTEHDAELLYSHNRRMNVLPKETCRVPLLSPCCAEVTAGAFQQAKQRASFMMQKMEIERLRKMLEQHVSRHLNIKWVIPSRQLDGLVPVGCLLSSVSLLQQLVLPAITLEFTVNKSPYVSEDDISVALGQPVSIRASIISSLEETFEGTLTLYCEQEISHQMGSINGSQHMLFLNNKKVPFRVKKNENDLSECTTDFDIVFRVEGNFRVRPQITPLPGQRALLPEDMFATPLAFSVNTKIR